MFAGEGGATSELPGPRAGENNSTDRLTKMFALSQVERTLQLMTHQQNNKKDSNLV